MLEIAKVEDIKVFSIKIDGILDEEIEVLTRDNNLVLHLRFLNTSSGIIIGNEVVNCLPILSDWYRNSSKQLSI